MLKVLPRPCSIIASSLLKPHRTTSAKYCSIIATSTKRSLHGNIADERLCISQEVKDVLNAGGPVVALESTIITHGMPFPQNLHTAQQVEQVIRDHGAVPATVAVLGGKLHVGLTEKSLVRLAERHTHPVKASRRDLPYLLSQGVDGGTTVSATMIAAHRAGIPVFVTGGLGGVHRDVETTMDVSADLTELGRTPVAIVCGGVKSILDIPRTLEYLETEGVCVATYGPTTDFPAFFTPKSGSQAPYYVTTPGEAAKLIDASLGLCLGSGLLLAVPIPSEFAADEKEIEQAIHQASLDARRQGIKGNAVTPFMLQRVNELMEGRSLEANIALIKNNAKVGSQIACELSRLRRGQGQTPTPPSGSPNSSAKHSSTFRVKPAKEPSASAKRPVVVGGTNVDFNASFATAEVQLDGGTYPGRVKMNFGGVGRNLADCLTRLGHQPLYLSAVGTDSHAQAFHSQASYMDLGNVLCCPDYNTATYCSTMSSAGDVLFGVGDFDIHTQITPQYLEAYEEEISAAALVVMDGNIPAGTMKYLCGLCSRGNVPGNPSPDSDLDTKDVINYPCDGKVFFEPTDMRNVSKIFEAGIWTSLTYASPNLNELRVLSSLARGEGITAQVLSDLAKDGGSSGAREADVLAEALELVEPVMQSIPNLLVTLGGHGVLLCTRRHGDQSASQSDAALTLPAVGWSAVHVPSVLPAAKEVPVVNVSGAGDCLAATFVSGALRGEEVQTCLAMAVRAAQLSLCSDHAVPPELSWPLLQELCARQDWPLTKLR